MMVNSKLEGKQEGGTTKATQVFNSQCVPLPIDEEEALGKH